MAGSHSFDIVCNLDLNEVKNACNMALKEIKTRYDFRNVKSDIVLDKEKISIISEDEFKLGSILDVLKTKLLLRKVSMKAIRPGGTRPSQRSSVCQDINLIQTLDQDNAKKIVKDIKNQKLKVQAQIQTDQIRVSGKKIDDLQTVMKFLKEKDYELPLQFVNFR